MDNGTVDVRILQHIGVIEKHDNGWAKEVNIVSWNNDEPKIDIREWSPDHKRMSRGLRFDLQQTETLANILARYIMEREARACGGHMYTPMQGGAQ